MKQEVADIQISKKGYFSVIERGRLVKKYCPHWGTLDNQPCNANCAFFQLEDKGPDHVPYEQRCQVTLGCSFCEPVIYAAVHISDDRLTMEQEMANEQENVQSR